MLRGEEQRKGRAEEWNRVSSVCFFFSFPLQEAALNSSYSFQTPSLLHPFLLFCSLGHTFLLFVKMKLSIILFRKLAIPCHSTLSNIWFSQIFQAKNTFTLAMGVSLSLSLSLSPQPQTLLPSFVWLHQSAIDAWQNKEDQASVMSKRLGLMWGPAISDELERESHLWIYISVVVNDPFILCETQWFSSFLPAGCQAAALL